MNAVETRTYRLPQHILSHLDYAAELSGLKKTTIVKQALERHLNEKFALPDDKSGKLFADNAA